MVAGTWLQAAGMCGRCGGSVAGPRVCILSLPACSNLQGVAGLPMFYDGPTLSLIQYPPVTEQVRAAAGHVG